MMLDYPKIMKNELLFVYALRFHMFSGALRLPHSFRELLGYSSWPQTVTFLKCTKEFLSNMQLSAKEFLEEHTVLPFYRMFMPEQKYKGLTEEEIVLSPYKMCFTLPKNQNTIKEHNKYLWYCPLCHSFQMDYSNIQNYHQIAEVHTCAEHQCYLKRIPLGDMELLAKPGSWDVSYDLCRDEWLNGIAGDIKYVMDTKPNIFLESFIENIWGFIECGNEFCCLAGWEERLNKQFINLPVEYRNSSGNFAISKFLNFITGSKNSAIEYLLLVRGMFGSFREFVNFIEGGTSIAA